MQTAVSFVRLQVRDDREVIELDLVADPTTPVEPPVEQHPGVFVDTARELLAQKLCALLSRTELRDLEDIGALLDAGGDLARGLETPPRATAGSHLPSSPGCCRVFPCSAPPRKVATNRDLPRSAITCWPR